MIRVNHIERKTHVLVPPRLVCLAEIPTINLTEGCGHACVYCYARGYSQFPGEGEVSFYTNTFEKLCRELPRKRTRPWAVYLSPASDPFQPIPEVLDMTYDILKFLFRRKTVVAVITKGLIPDRHMRLVADNHELARMRIGLSTMDARVSRVFEPNAPSPEVRMAQAKVLASAGIDTAIRTDPILPGITDDAETIVTVFEAMRDAGVNEIAISVLFLRKAIVNGMRRSVADKAMLQKLLGNYRPGKRLSIYLTKSTIITLPAVQRQEIYSRFRDSADRFGIRVRVCSCMNPDIPADSCNIAGKRPPERGPIQRTLFGGS